MSGPGGVDRIPRMSGMRNGHPARLAAAFFALALCGVSCQKRTESGRRNAGPLQPCRLPGIDEELQCGKLTVYENRERRAGRKIALNVVVLPALESRGKQDPLFDLAGGPGEASTGGASFYAKEGREFRRHRDVVLVDQRGTGGSNPLMRAAHLRSPQEYLTEMYPVTYVKALRAELETRADLAQYTTSIAADDLDDVRAWLGYDRVNLFGLSYGTRVAQVYMRQHPEHVRAAILCGVVPTNLKIPLYHAEAARRAMDLLLQECERDAACHAAFPEIQREWRDVIDHLGREPAQAQYAPPDQSGPVTVEIQRDIFAEKLRNGMYSRATSRRIPFIIHQAAHDDFGPFLKEAIPADRSGEDFIADGMYLAVTCAEDTPFIDPAEAVRLNAGNPFGNYRVEQQMRACSMWPRGKIPAGYHEPVTSDIPVLLFSGNLDPVTPPQRGEEVASQLPNSRHIIIPEGAHALEGLTHPECLDDLMRTFLENPDPRTLDTSCVATMRPPPFATKKSD